MAYEVGMIGKLYNRFGNNTFTYKDAGIHYATLNAAASRGLLNKVNNTYSVAAKGHLFNQLETLQLISGFEWIGLKRCGEELGMHCEVKGMDVLDCWGKPFDYTSVEEYSFSKNWNKIEKIAWQKFKCMV